MEKRLEGIRARAVQKLKESPELSKRKYELFEQLHIAKTGDATYDAVIQYEISLSIKQQLGAEQGRMLEKMVQEAFTNNEVPFAAQQFFLNGECVEQKPRKGYKIIDFVVSRQTPPKASHSVMISCKTTLRERGALDDAIVPAFRRSYMITYDDAEPNPSMRYVRLTKGNEKNELGMFCADLTREF